MGPTTTTTIDHDQPLTPNGGAARYKPHHAVLRRRTQERAARKGELDKLQRERRGNVSAERLVTLANEGRAYAAVLPELEVEARLLGLPPDLVTILRWVHTAVGGFGNYALIASHLDFARLAGCSRRKAADLVRRAVRDGYLVQQPWFVRRADKAELSTAELAVRRKRPQGREVKPHYRPGPRLLVLTSRADAGRMRRANLAREIVDAVSRTEIKNQVSNLRQPSKKEPQTQIRNKGGPVPGRHLSTDPVDHAIDMLELEALTAHYAARAEAEGFWTSELRRPEAPEGGGPGGDLR